MAIDLNKIKEQYEKLNNKSSGNFNSEEFLKQFIKLEEGDNPVRILPPKEGSDVFYVATALHRIPGGKSWHCRKLKGESCPLCDLYYALWNKHNDIAGGDKKRNTPYSTSAREIKPNKRFFMNALDRRTNEVKILSVGSIIFEKIINDMMDPTEPLGDITDVKTGYDLNIVKVTPTGGTDKWPKYDKSKFRKKESALGTPAEIAKYLEQLFDLDKYAPLEDYDEMKKVADNLSVKYFNTPSSGGGSKVTEGESQESFLSRLQTKEDEE